MTAYEKLYINGQWVPSSGTDTLSVTDSATEEVIATIPEGTAADVDAAVAAAKAAFPAWSALPKEERAAYLMKIHAGLEARTDEIASTIAKEVGMPLFLSNLIQAGLPKANFAIAAQLLGSYEFEKQVGNSLVVREAIGGVGCITPWNYPLHQIALKVAPAMAAGNTVVLKPSEVAPINAFILAEVIAEAGLPAGVFNLVTGIGPVVGEAISAHPDVDMVSFTGSTRAGKRVAEVASQTVKKVSLELGGKSANVILADATAAAFTPGNPFDSSSRIGPLVSAAQRERVRGFIQKGIDEGATLLTGGPASPEGLEQGYYVAPTVFSNVTRTMTIANEEIFGPVLSIIPYDTEEEAIEIANDTIYGLAGGVWGEADHAKAVARKIRAGQVEVNGGAFNVMAPFGGYKQSGLGREAGTFGLEEFLEVKSLQL